MKIREFINYLKEIEKGDLNESKMMLLNKILWKLNNCLNAKNETSFKREIEALERANREKLMRKEEEFLEKIENINSI